MDVLRNVKRWLESGMSQEDVAKTMGVSVEWVRAVVGADGFGLV